MEMNISANRAGQRPIEVPVGAATRNEKPAREEVITAVGEALRQIKHDFGNEVAGIAGPIVREKAFARNDSTITPSEREAYRELSEIIKEFSALSELHIDKSSMRTLLTDTLKNLQEKHREDFQQPITIVCTICPDYEYDRINKTYKSEGELGDKIGLSATTTLRKIVPLLKVLSEHGVAMQLQLCYADIEAKDPSMLRKVELDPETFKGKVALSRLHAEAVTDRLFHRLGIRCGIAATSMEGLVSDVDTSGRSIHEKTASGIARDRSSFYSRFFADEIREYRSPEDFYIKRAGKDIDDHLIVGQALGNKRIDGERAWLVTLSRPVLANLFNSGITDQKARVPVIRLEQSY